MCVFEFIYIYNLRMLAKIYVPQMALLQHSVFDGAANIYSLSILLSRQDHKEAEAIPS